MLWQKTDRTFTGTIVCFVNIGRNNPIPAKFTKINAQRVPTASRLSLIFPTIFRQMTFRAMLTHVSRLNFNVRPLLVHQYRQYHHRYRCWSSSVVGRRCGCRHQFAARERERERYANIQTHHTIINRENEA